MCWDQPLGPGYGRCCVFQGRSLIIYNLKYVEVSGMLLSLGNNTIKTNKLSKRIFEFTQISWSDEWLVSVLGSQFLCFQLFAPFRNESHLLRFQSSSGCTQLFNKCEIFKIFKAQFKVSNLLLASCEDDDNFLDEKVEEKSISESRIYK